MNILALNAGSSSLKYELLQITEEATAAKTVLMQGEREHVGGDGVTQAAEQAVDACLAQTVEAVGVRVVHGGARFVEPTRMTPEAIEALRALNDLAPLHNPVALAVIESVRRRLPEISLIAVFDTAFHRTLPEVAYDYALPLAMSREFGLRRYGFHGISHRYVSERLLACLGREATGTRLIVCHLGSGASLCALRDGRSVDTSMGMTPLEGLVMGTRSGDVDPGLLLYLLNTRKMTAALLDDLLNHKSGLLGLSGRSNDVRDLEEASQAGDARAKLALSVFAYRARKYIGAYAAALGGLDAVAFTGGIGEHSSAQRADICQGLGFLGLSLDESRNRAASGKEAQPIHREGSRAQVWVIPTDENLQIARETYALLRQDLPGR